MDFLIYAAAALVLIPALYTYTASMVQMRFPRLMNKRICLLIAHPDDEAMFFAPTVLALTRPETGNHVKILCLSTGDADGLGETRRKELVKSAASLGVRPDDVWVEDRPLDFPDSMTQVWDPSKISTLLFQAFAPHLLGKQSQAAQKQAPTAAIDVIITFDKNGVSSHPNHISLYHGARTFLADLMRGKAGWTNPVDLYTLSSVSVVRKYTWILDALPTLALWARASNFKNKTHPEALVFMNQLVGGELAAAWDAMTKAHKSQMVWFRYGWICLSRYMVMNDLRREKVKASS